MQFADVSKGPLVREQEGVVVTSPTYGAAEELERGSGTAREKFGRSSGVSSGGVRAGLGRSSAAVRAELGWSSGARPTPRFPPCGGAAASALGLPVLWLGLRCDGGGKADGAVRGRLGGGALRGGVPLAAVSLRLRVPVRSGAARGRPPAPAGGDHPAAGRLRRQRLPGMRRAVLGDGSAVPRLPPCPGITAPAGVLVSLCEKRRGFHSLSSTERMASA